MANTQPNGGDRRKRRFVTQEEALEWKCMYEEGASIEDIALEVGRGMPVVRAWLHKVGTEMRSPHRRGAGRKVEADGKGRTPGIRQARIGQRAYRGHRRRSAF